jgi:hypothetical protein
VDDDLMMFAPDESSTIDGFTLSESQNEDFINRIFVVDC